MPAVSKKLAAAKPASAVAPKRKVKLPKGKAAKEAKKLAKQKLNKVKLAVSEQVPRYFYPHHELAPIRAAWLVGCWRPMRLRSWPNSRWIIMVFEHGYLCRKRYNFYRRVEFSHHRFD